MTVAIRVGNAVEEIGTADFLHAFFSTVSHHLEPNGWGSRFPELMTQFYQGKLHARHATKVINDLVAIRRALAALPPSEIVWDIEDRAKQPPWGTNISSDITDLSNYFVTSRGRDLFEVLLELLDKLVRKGGVLTVEQY